MIDPYFTNSQQYNNGNFAQTTIPFVAAGTYGHGFVQQGFVQQGTEAPHIVINAGNNQLHRTQPQLSGQHPMNTIPLHSTYMYPQMPRATKPDNQMQKRERKAIPIINPKTNEEVIINKRTNPNSSGTNTHSSALKIEAPSPAHTPMQSDNSQNSQQPQNSRTTMNMPSAQSTSDGSATMIATSNETEQPTCKLKSSSSSSSSTSFLNF